MFEAFVNPWSMVVGGALVASPIIIHLINRLRYRRIRWAAMEFLLKAQKKQRRKLIIEQLILLLLRILLVLLLGILLARFLGFGASGASDAATATVHVVVVDDTPSMGDAWKGDDGRATDAFEVARGLVADKIAATLNQATTPQQLIVLRLSTLDVPYPFEGAVRVNASEIETLRQELRRTGTSAVHVRLSDGLRRAKSLLDGWADATRLVHVVGDFRTFDWEGPDRDALAKEFETLKALGVKLHLHDAAHPLRQPTQNLPGYHENLGITDLRPESRVAVPDLPFEFVVRVANWSNSERKGVQLAVRVNGEEKREASVAIASLPPNQESEERILVRFPRPSGTNPLDRFQLVSVSLPDEAAGLAIDNTRHALVEVQDAVRLLMIDSNPRNEGKGPTDDSYNLKKLFGEAVAGYEVVVRDKQELESPNLQQYGGIYLLNVDSISEKAVRDLEDYVRGGGGLAFFLGPRVNPAFYNKVLYADGAGVFPAPLADRPNLEPIDRQKRGAFPFNFNKDVFQVWPRDDVHPGLADLYRDERGRRVNPFDYNKFLCFVVIDKYWPVLRNRWKRDDRTAELMSLPNFREMKVYEPRVVELLNRLQALVDKPEHERWRSTLESYRSELRRIAASNEGLFALGLKLDELLKDEGGKDKRQPPLKEFWGRPEVADLAREVQALRDDVRYGDPLYVAKAVGNGRVVLFTTTANATWNDINGYGKFYYPPLLKVMQQKYLGAAGTDVNLKVGQPLELSFDAKAYQNTAARSFVSLDTLRRGAGRALPTSEAAQAQGADVMETKEDRHLLRYNLVRSDGSKSPRLVEPGGYVLKLTLQKAAVEGTTVAEQVPVYRGYSFNVDAPSEGNLRRMDREELLKLASGAQLHTPETNLRQALQLKKSDWSESGWPYLVLLLLLVAEQFMSVRLSFHTRAVDAGPPAARAAPVV